jgi:hypothetical protein
MEYTNLRPSKIYRNWDFWFENIPSGNPVLLTLGCHGFLRDVVDFSDEVIFRCEMQLQLVEALFHCLEKLEPFDGGFAVFAVSQD